MQASGVGGKWSRPPAIGVVRCGRADAGRGRRAARHAFFHGGCHRGSRERPSRGARHGGKGRRCVAAGRAGRAVASPSVVGAGAGALGHTGQRAGARRPRHARRARDRRPAAKEAVGVAVAPARVHPRERPRGACAGPMGVRRGAPLGGEGGTAAAAAPASAQAPRRRRGGTAAGGTAAGASVAAGAHAPACVGAPPRRPRNWDGRSEAGGGRQRVPPARGRGRARRRPPLCLSSVRRGRRSATRRFPSSRRVPGSEVVAVNISRSHAPGHQNVAAAERSGSNRR